MGSSRMGRTAKWYGKVGKGGQVVLFSNVDRIWPCAYVHRHKFWERPAGFIIEGSNEARMILENLDKMIIAEGHAGNRQDKGYLK